MAVSEYRMAQRVKPVGLAGIEKILKIVQECQMAKVNEVAVDLFTAGAVAAIWKNLNEVNRDKLAGLPVVKVCEVCLRLCR